MIRSLCTHVAGLAVAGCLTLGAAQIANAQEDISDTKLESFVTAVLAVNQVVEKWRPQIEAEEDQTRAQTLAEEANAEMVGAIEQTQGISVDEYQQIAQAAQADADLMGRIDGLLADQPPQ